MNYSIADITGQFDVNASTLRYYETIGLLTDVERNSSGYRVYSEKHIARLDAINCFKQAGMSISEIQSFFSYESDIKNNIDNMCGLLTSRSDKILEDFEELFKSYAHILRKVDFYNTLKKSIETDSEYPTWDSFDEQDYRKMAFDKLQVLKDIN